ncbi:MAG: hypothetical protein AAB941_01385 [Patescibacteria group bacterium]
MTTERLNAAVKATDDLTVDELADLINHLGDGTLEDIQREPWKHHIAHFLPAIGDAETIHTLWVLLKAVHDSRYVSRKHQTRTS